jgi:hypothetical protein
LLDRRRFFHAAGTGLAATVGACAAPRRGDPLIASNPPGANTATGPLIDDIQSRAFRFF